MLYVIPPSHVCQAWKDGAHMLGIACEKAAGEVTADQLKMLCARGEKALLCVQVDDAKAWLAVTIDQLPNKRVLFVYGIYAPGATGDVAMSELRKFAQENGCEAIRGCCNDAVQRLWERRFKARKIYTTVEIDL